MHRTIDRIQWERHINYSAWDLAHRRCSISGVIICHSRGLASGGWYKVRPERDLWAGEGWGVVCREWCGRGCSGWLTMRELKIVSRRYATPTSPLLSSPPRGLSACVPSPALGPSPPLWFLFVRIHYHSLFILLCTLCSFYLPASFLASWSFFNPFACSLNPIVKITKLPCHSLVFIKSWKISAGKKLRVLSSSSPPLNKDPVTLSQGQWQRCWAPGLCLMLLPPCQAASHAAGYGCICEKAASA